MHTTSKSGKWIGIVDKADQQVYSNFRAVTVHGH